MRRLFWLSVGAAAGYYAARKGSEALEGARERGLVGNVSLAASTATRVASSATRATAAMGEAVSSRGRASAGPEPAPSPGAAPVTDLAPEPPSSTSSRSREVRP